MRTTLSLRLTLVVAIVATIGCDRVTKQLAATALPGVPSESFFHDTVRLEYAENAGGFLSLGTGLSPALRTGGFTIGTGLALPVLIAAPCALPFRLAVRRADAGLSAGPDGRPGNGARFLRPC